MKLSPFPFPHGNVFRNRLHLLKSGGLLAIFLITMATASAQTTSTWSGPINGSLNTAGNWTPSGVPVASDSVTNIMQWNGATPGTLDLTYNGAIGNGGTQNDGLNLNLTSAQTDSVTINSLDNSFQGGQTFRVRNLTIDSGAGAFSLGNGGTAKVNMYLGGVGAFTTPTYTNNSSHTATLGSNIQVIGTGNNDRRTWTLGGSGNWEVAAPTANSNTYTANIATQKMGTITLVKSGAGTLRISNSLNTYAGAVTIDGGTLQSASDTALGWGASMLSTQNSALNIVNGTTVNSAGTLDLINNITVNEQVTLVNGGTLINSQAGSTSTLNNGLAGVVLTNIGTSNCDFHRREYLHRHHDRQRGHLGH